MQRLEQLSSTLGAEIWVKREDLSAPRYGGNKVRKLEPLLAAARQQGCQSVVTVGGIGSNHVLATAIYARQLGLPTWAVVVPQPLTAAVRQTVCKLQSLEVHLIPCTARPLVPVALALARRQAPRPYAIGPGGSSPLGTLGYAAAALELDDQLRGQDLPRPDALFIACGSGGSLAGLALGLSLTDWRPLLMGVRVVERLYCNRPWLQHLIRQGGRLFQQLGIPRPDKIIKPLLLNGYIGKGYGHPTPAAQSAQGLAADTEGLLLETTYTAKTLAALADYARGPGRGKRLLFWQTYNSQDLGWIDALAPERALPERVSRWLH